MDENQQDNNKARWEEAFEQTANYRNYLLHLSLDDKEKIISYSLTEEDINAILQQDGKHLDGIRIYIGHKMVEGDKAVVRLHVVGTQKHSSGRYDDYFVSDKNGDHFPPFKVTDRPCPSQCSYWNKLNPNLNITPLEEE